MRNIWTRYTLKELAKVFFLFLGAFYFLYVLIDYSTHAKALQGAGLFNSLLYYLFQFTQRAEILVPVGLMLASIKVMTTLNNRNELVAMISGGIPMKRLLRPFMAMALIIMGFLYLNAQYLQPQAHHHLNQFEKTFFRSEHAQMNAVESLPLADHSTLLYSHYDPTLQAFIDAYWLRSEDEIFHATHLYPLLRGASGANVDHLKREPSGDVTLTAHHLEMYFPSLHIDPDLTQHSPPLPKWQSISALFPSLSLTWSRHSLHDQDAERLTSLLYKLFLPLTCLLVIMAPAPYCLRFGRHLPIFLIYALALFGLITFLTLVNSSVILAKNQAIPPLWALTTIFVLPLLFFGYRYAKL